MSLGVQMGNGKYPDYRARNFVSTKRPTPVLLGDFTANALGPGVHHGANTSPLRGRGAAPLAPVCPPGRPAGASSAAVSERGRATAADKAAVAAEFAKESGLSPRTVTRLLAKVEERNEEEAEVQSVFAMNYSGYLNLPHKDKKLQLNMRRAPASKTEQRKVLVAAAFSLDDANHQAPKSAPSRGSRAVPRADAGGAAPTRRSDGLLSTPMSPTPGAGGRVKSPEKQTVRISSTSTSISPTVPRSVSPILIRRERPLSGQKSTELPLIHAPPNFGSN
jgi:hypothetical protein